MRIVILTGAGISAESGLATFRDENGLWMGHSIEDVATPGGYHRNPQYVLDFYNECRKATADAKPNAAHIALTKLQQSDHHVYLVTQNVDDLHEKAGSKAIHMHGSLAFAVCESCGYKQPASDSMSIHDQCSDCGSRSVRPDIVWFGEEPHFMLDIDHELRRCDLFLAIGTSGNVYPAAGFANIVKRKGGRTIEFNLKRPENSNDFMVHHEGPASQTVTQWVDEFLET